MIRLAPWMSALAAAGLLAACGGGSDPVAEAPLTTVPASAQATPEAYVAFATALPTDEQPSDPLTLDSVVPPTSETAEPAPLAR